MDSTEFDVRSHSVSSPSDSVLEQLIALGGDGVATFTLELRCTFWSARLASLFGTPSSAAIGRSLAELLGNDHELEAARAARDGETVTAPPRLLADIDGQQRLWQARFAPLRDAAGTVTGALALLRPVEASALESASVFRTMADDSPVLLWLAAVDARCTFFNRQWLEFTGRAMADELGFGWTEGVHPEDFGTCVDTYMAAFSARRKFTMEYRLRRHDGEYRWLLDTGVPYALHGGCFAGFIGSCIDITDRKAAEEANERARREAETTNRVKDEFLATLSHELRTPLNAILGWSEYLLSGSEALSEDDTRRGFETIARNARLQSRLVSDLLDVSRIVTGKLVLAHEVVDLGQVIEAAVDSVRLSISAKRLTLDLTIDPSVGPVSGDAARLQQVVWNLLANAVRHVREQGRIEVALERCGGLAEVQVKDDGEGIARELLPFVFNRFWQEDSGLRRRHGGLGLGLAIVRHLVEMHGGQVAVDSPGKGCGATFRFRLPLMAVRLPSRAWREATSPPCLVSTRLAGLRVLCIDDHDDVLTLVARLLLRAGAKVETAQSVHEGLESLEQSRPDVIVCDVEMPGACGLDLAHELRARQLPVPALALSAHAHESDKRAALEAGFRAYLFKPVNGAALVEQVAALAGRSAEERTP
jgi:PAS domain S-box-containing protein